MSPPPWGHYQIHVNGDIAHAVYQYLYSSQDVQFIKDHWDFITAMADFWVSRAVHNDNLNAYEILGEYLRWVQNCRHFFNHDQAKSFLVNCN